MRNPMRNRMRNLIAILCVLAFATGLLASCAPSRLEMDRGTSYKLQKANQIANPDAGKDVKPVEGLDGQAAAAAVTKRQKEFEKQDKAPSYIFNLGNTNK